MPAEEECPSGSRAATFRHIFGQTPQRSEWFDWGSGLGSAVVANPKFLAVAIDGGAGGQIVVGTHEDFGKHGRIGLVRLQDHTNVVTDIKWSNFNDNVLASGSADCSVKIWHISDQMKAQCVRTLAKHSRRVDQIEWHTTVDNVLLSAGSDSKIFLWDIEANSVIYEISDFSSSCIAFAPNSALFAATSRQSHRVCIFDARTGNAMKSAALPHDGGMPPKVIFATAQRLITFGNTKINRRQFAIYSISSFGSPLATIDIDGSSGLLCPIFDPDLNILYVSGKGDSTFRLYELTTRTPYVIYLTECQQQAPHTCICTISKRALHLTGAEVMRVYRLYPQSLLIQPLSFIVPRRSDQFHPDLYPPTRGPTPAVSLPEWRAGLDVAPVQLQLRPGQLNTTSKPLRLRGRSGSPKLITSDLNNEMKFRFLSQTTKPDYRSIDEREDCEEIIKLIEVKQKVQEGRVSSPRSEEEIEEAADAVAELQKSAPPMEPVPSPLPPPSREGPDRPQELFPPVIVDFDNETPVSEPIEIRASSARSSLRDSHETPPLKAERLRLSPSPRDRHLSLDRLFRRSSPNPPLRCPGDARISPRLVPSPLHFADSAIPSPQRRAVDEPVHSVSNPFKQYFQKETKNGIKEPRSDLSRRSDESMLSLATCGTAPIVAAESVDDLDTEVSILNGNLRDDGSGSDTARSLDEGHRLLENTVTMLERQLRRSDNRILELERLCELQQETLAWGKNHRLDDSSHESLSSRSTLVELAASVMANMVALFFGGLK
ncbi:hypothetical protein Q1695_009955 [Nippostrongylus brasiliensis]|nr:hypothetical protein Q1695_009955 [Nippostrongylus brasiliensis]